MLPPAEELLGPRVGAQPLAALNQHRALYAAVYGNPRVMRLVHEAVPPSRIQESFDGSLQASSAAGWRPSRWCLFDRTTGRGLGVAGSTQHTGSGRVELGVLLVPEAQGRGYGNETLRVLMDAFVQPVGITTFWGRHHPGNHAMARVFERLSFTPAGALGGLCVWECVTSAASR